MRGGEQSRRNLEVSWTRSAIHMIKTVKGNVLSPIVQDGTRVIAHVVNNQGKWGAGFSGNLSKKWPEPERYYRQKARWDRYEFKLGNVQWVYPDFNDESIAVVNLIAQHSTHSHHNKIPIRYDALEKCLKKLDVGAKAIGPSTIHMPMIGAGLARGDWGEIYKLIEKTLISQEVYIYEWDGS